MENNFLNKQIMPGEPVINKKHHLFIITVLIIILLFAVGYATVVMHLIQFGAQTNESIKYNDGRITLSTEEASLKSNQLNNILSQKPSLLSAAETKLKAEQLKQVYYQNNLNK